MEVYLNTNEGKEYYYSNKEDFITEIALEVYEEHSYCLDSEDFESAVYFAENVLNYRVIVNY